MVGTDAPSYKRLREVWRSMHKRCYNPNSKDYGKYGGRGIKVCEAWHDFETFYTWAMSHGYRDDLTLERVAVNRGYSPGNCRWITRKAQAYNRRTNKRYVVDGRSKTLKEWSIEYGVPDYTIIHRLKAGWSLEDAIKKPLQNKKK